MKRIWFAATEDKLNSVSKPCKLNPADTSKPRPSIPENQNFWVVSKPDEPVDVCYINPGYDVDLFITAKLEVMVSVYFGYTRLAAEIENERISLIGQTPLARSIGKWLVLSSFSPVAATKTQG